MEVEEEDYFNNSDDEETPKTTPSWPPVSLASVNTLKRKRAKGFTRISGSPLPKQLRPANVVIPRLPPSLVDYEDDEAEGSNDASSSKIGDAAGRRGTSPEAPTSRPIDWFSHSRTSEPAAPRSPLDTPYDGFMRSVSPPPHLGAKRRRSEEDDDDDELLERLVRGKRRGRSSSVEREEPKSPKPKPTGLGKMKLKLGSTSLSLTSPSANPPEKETKDGDGG